MLFLYLFKWPGIITLFLEYSTSMFTCTIFGISVFACLCVLSNMIMGPVIYYYKQSKKWKSHVNCKIGKSEEKTEKYYSNKWTEEYFRGILSMATIFMFFERNFKYDNLTFYHFFQRTFKYNNWTFHHYLCSSRGIKYDSWTFYHYLCSSRGILSVTIEHFTTNYVLPEELSMKAEHLTTTYVLPENL